jgi:hypothetical protein
LGTVTWPGMLPMSALMRDTVVLTITQSSKLNGVRLYNNA